jgi:hypothetical protein
MTRQLHYAAADREISTYTHAYTYTHTCTATRATPQDRYRYRTVIAPAAVRLYVLHNDNK